MREKYKRLTTISMVPRVILVVICKAWKKLVFSGPRFVTWAGRTTSQGAMAPALAGAATLFSCSFSRMNERSCLVNTKPTFSKMCGKSFSRLGFFSKWPRMAFFIIVFLPMRMTAWPRKLMRIFCICDEPTLSAPTMKHFGYSSRYF